MAQFLEPLPNLALPDLINHIRTLCATEKLHDEIQAGFKEMFNILAFKSHQAGIEVADEPIVLRIGLFNNESSYNETEGHAVGLYIKNQYVVMMLGVENDVITKYQIIDGGDADQLSPPTKH